ncbi:MAG: hypothetical protein LBC97_11255 [Bifidobacteriaceae bacterium]|nr:hypothetical protein [Bifidobacteriaceae bacterium]
MLRLPPLALAGGEFALVALTGLIGLGGPSYWYDEVVSLEHAQAPIADLPGLVRSHDLVHAAYYATLHYWGQAFGWSEVATRSLSLIAVALAGAGFVLLLRALRGGAVALAGGVVFAFTPGLNWAGDEARSFALALAFAVWATYFLVKACRAGSRAALWWIAYALAMTAGTVFLIYVPLLAAAHMAIIWNWAAGPRHAARRGAGSEPPSRFRRWRRPWLGFAASWALIGALTLPFAIRVGTQRGQVGWLPDGLAELAARFAVGQLFMFPRDRDGGLVGWHIASAVMAFLVGLALVAALAARSRNDLGARRAGVTALIWFALPSAALIGLSVVYTPSYLERYVVFAVPGAVWLFAEGLVALWRTRPRLGAVAAVALLAPMAASCAIQHAQTAKFGEDFRSLAGLAAAADGFVHANDATRLLETAYPGQFLRAADLIPSGAIAATDVPPNMAGSGLVAFYFPTDQPGLADRFEAEVAAPQGCEVKDRVIRARFSGYLLSCP